MADWKSERRARDERLDAGSKFAEGKKVAPNNTTALLEAVIRPGDRICLEGDNQKQADFLAACLVKANPKVLHDLHVVQSGIMTRPGRWWSPSSSSGPRLEACASRSMTGERGRTLFTCA